MGFFQGAGKTLFKSDGSAGRNPLKYGKFKMVIEGTKINTSAKPDRKDKETVIISHRIVHVDDAAVWTGAPADLNPEMGFLKKGTEAKVGDLVDILYPEGQVGVLDRFKGYVLKVFGMTNDEFKSKIAASVEAKRAQGISTTVELETEANLMSIVKDVSQPLVGTIMEIHGVPHRTKEKNQLITKEVVVRAVPAAEVAAYLTPEGKQLLEFGVPGGRFEKMLAREGAPSMVAGK